MVIYRGNSNVLIVHCRLITSVLLNNTEVALKRSSPFSPVLPFLRDYSVSCWNFAQSTVPGFNIYVCIQFTKSPQIISFGLL